MPMRRRLWIQATVIDIDIIINSLVTIADGAAFNLLAGQSLMEQAGIDQNTTQG